MQETSSKMIWIVIAVVAVAAGGFLYYRMKTAQAPEAPQYPVDIGASAADITDVEAELQEIDLNGLGSETASIDQEIGK